MTLNQPTSTAFVVMLTRGCLCPCRPRHAAARQAHRGRRAQGPGSSQGGMQVASTANHVNETEASYPVPSSLFGFRAITSRGVVVVMQGMRYFTSFSAQDQRELGRCVTLHEFDKGATVYKQGDHGRGGREPTDRTHRRRQSLLTTRASCCVAYGHSVLVLRGAVGLCIRLCGCRTAGLLR